MVRLLLYADPDFGHPTDVSIPQWCDCCREIVRDDSASQARFNPTMVRLLQVYESDVQRLVCAFQSHNGAIAAAAKTLRKR